MIIDDYFYGESPATGWWCKFPTMEDAFTAFALKLLEDLLLS